MSHTHSPLLRVLLGALAVLSACTANPGPEVPAPDQPPNAAWVDHYTRRTFPSVFSPWASARDLNLFPDGPATPLSTRESSLETWCRHDVIWKGPGGVGLKFNHPYPGMADGFDPGTLAAGLAVRTALLGCNPNAVLAIEIRYRDAPEGYLPADSPWWQRDAQGNRILGWKEGGYFLLDFANPGLQKRIAAQCLAAVQSGVADGCFFDWWSKETPDRLALIRLVRATIGKDALIIVNVNGARPVQSAPYVNGIYLEGFGAPFFDGWRTAANNLLWSRSALAAPAITAFEGWFPTPREDPTSSGRNDVRRMRMVTALSLVFSDGAVLFADPNPLPTPDHLHDWYPFWDRSLGGPVGEPGLKREDGSYWRRYEKGTVVFNPPENGPVAVEFAEARTSRASHVRARTHRVESGDGDLFLD